MKKALSEVVKMEEALGESLTDKGQKEKIAELSERYSKLITLTERDGFPARLPSRSKTDG